MSAISSYSQNSVGYAGASRCATGPAAAHAPRRLAGVDAITSASDEVAAGASAPTDLVDFSAAALAASEQGRAGGQVDGDVRADKIARARQLISSGAYDSPEVLDKVADRLLGVLKNLK
ncbi:hypothetical protein BH11PLA1_BH11PLA1_15960 [soil metagenome]